jgi:hypothetical protein
MIARDAVSSTVDVGAGSSTITTTVVTGSSSNLILAIIHDQNGGALGNVTGCTANGTAMTLWASHRDAVSVDRCTYVFALVAPAISTSYSIVATRSSTSFDMTAISAAYSGAAATNAADASNYVEQSSGASLSLTLTTVHDDCWCVSCVISNGTFSADTNATPLASKIADEIYADSNATLGSAGAKTVAMTVTSGTAFGLFAVSFAPPTVAAVKGGFLALL